MNISNFDALNRCIELIYKSEAFDYAFYKEVSGIKEDNHKRIISNYLLDGLVNCFDPHPCFNTKYYKEFNKDLRDAPIHPFVHFLLFGYKEARYIREDFFIPDYKARFPEIDELDINPLKHFTQRFGENNFKAYLSEIKPSSLVSIYSPIATNEVAAEQRGLPHGTIEISEENFDREWYLKQNPDVASAGVDPYLHYKSHGLYEGRPAISKLYNPVQFSKLDELGRKNIFDRIKSWGRQPLISVIMPVYNPREEWLREAIDSVLNQLYENWELCICDDASPSPQIKKILNTYKRKDKRIKIVFSKKNGRVSAASNKALKFATGDYIALLDHDDVLEEQALFRVAHCCVEHDPDLMYSDELLTSEDINEVVNHSFRPAYSPELYLSHCYFVHLVVVKAGIIQKISGFDEQLKISQDYDFVLRALEHSSVVAHIPEALYRWRTHSSSSGHLHENEVMTTSAQIISNHLTRLQIEHRVEPSSFYNFFEVRYPLQPNNKVAIIIPTKNHGDILKQCIDSIEATVTNVDYEIVVINHDSTDPKTIDYFKFIANKHRVLKYSGEFNFSTINNYAVCHVSSDCTHYLFCNNDIEAINNDWLQRMLELAQQKDVGVVGAKLFYPDRNKIQHAGVCFGLMGAAEHYGKFMDKDLDDGKSHPGYIGSFIANREISAVTAACMLVRKESFSAVGGYDPLLKVGFGDVDLCLRIKRIGYRILLCPGAELIHHESYSRGASVTDPHPEDSALFRARWEREMRKGDFYYNKNLSIYSTRWELEYKVNFPNKYHGNYLDIFTPRVWIKQ